MDLDFNKKRIKKLKNSYIKIIKKIDKNIDKNNFDEYIDYIYLLNKNILQLEEIIKNINLSINKKTKNDKINLELKDHKIMDNIINQYKPYIFSNYLAMLDTNLE